MEHNDKIKKAFWITEDMDREIDAHLKLDNCSSRSEFVMNALKFYVGYGPSSTRCVGKMLPVWNTTTLMRGARSSWRTHRRWRSR